MLYLVGIGLWDEKDITLKGVEAIKKCRQVFLESYTSKLNCTVEQLEKLYGKKIRIATRDTVENENNEIIEAAKTEEIALIVIGDPFCATTHIDLMLRAKEAGIRVKVINNASILTAVGITGLELYKFGRTTSIPFENKNVDSVMNVIKANKKNGLHTLILFDLDPPKNMYMTVCDAIDYLQRKGMKEELCIGLGGVGSDDPEIKVGNLSDVAKARFTKLPQCMIIPAALHFKEEEALKRHSTGK